MQKMTFNQWLITVWGITPHEYDNSYSGQMADEIYAEWLDYLDEQEEQKQ